MAAALGAYDCHHNHKAEGYHALAAAGIRRVRFHDIQHTFASLLLHQAESLTYVQDRLRLNLLTDFRMDIDTEKGLVHLEKK